MKYNPITWPKYLALGLIKLYQATPVHLTHGSCRFQPTCSVYTFQAIQQFGLLKGGWLGMKRLVRCGPFGGKGYDPIPEKFEFKFSNAKKDK